jgi:hypothetical protein
METMSRNPRLLHAALAAASEAELLAQSSISAAAREKLSRIRMKCREMR